MKRRDNLPLVQELTYQDPCVIFSFFYTEPWAIFLDSAKTQTNLGRYSFIALDPFQTLVSKNGHIEFADQCYEGDPFKVLQQQLQQFPQSRHVDVPLFQGGIAGFFGYDLCHHLEQLPSARCDDRQFPDLAVGFYDVVLAFDHVLRRAWIFSSGYPAQDSARQKRARERCDYFVEKLSRVAPRKKLGTMQSAFNLESNFTADNYQKMVQQVIDYIYAGDLYQANVSQRFSAQMSEEFDPYELYCRLRSLNPAPFAAYLNCLETVLVSASPERFLQCINNNVESRPIKGTRPRGKTLQEDVRLANELLKSEKDRAENTMIVDLIRNDLSKVCLPHSVQVAQCCGLESYATVHHLVSVVKGQLQHGYDAIDLLRATFPGGSITGAPKIRAMEIIAELEPTPRGPYCGSIGYIGFDGSVDLSITIRTYAIKDHTITFQVGGGIVADSDPQAEYEETLVKAAALQQALVL